MPRKDRFSITSELLDLLMLAPVWVGPVFAVATYLVMRYVLPGVFGAATDDPLGKSMGTTFATFSRQAALLFALAVACIWVVAEFLKRQRRHLLDSQEGIESIRRLPWPEFEALAGEAFRREGYLVEETGSAAGDGGVDLVLRRGGETVLVQCKQWQASKVDVRPVRELYGVVAARKASAGIVVTSGVFTSGAQDFARDLPLRLIDGPALAALVAGVQRPPPNRSASAGGPAPAAAAPQVASAAPACPRCGSPMARRVARNGPRAGRPFWGCSKYPQCRGTRDAAD